MSPLGNQLSVRGLRSGRKVAGSAVALMVVLVVATGTVAGAGGGTTERVSVATGGTQSNEFSLLPSISADGRHVAFNAAASNLVVGDSNGIVDAFVHDRETGVTELVSVATDGTQSNNRSERATISPDGRHVAFESRASNLVPGDSNGVMDAFVHDRQTATTERVSIATDGTQGNNASYETSSMSADGRYVVFRSWASNLVPGDTNKRLDVFVRDRQTATTELVSVATDGTRGNGHSAGGSITADGRQVAFQSRASNLVTGDSNNYGDVFVRDRPSGTTERVSVATDGTQGNGGYSGEPRISADGRYVAFNGTASNLVPGDTNNRGDVFVRDRQAATTELVSVATDGTQGNHWSSLRSISADARHVAFHARASNLVAGDTNEAWDVFVHDRHSATTELVSVATDGGPGSTHSSNASISADGGSIAFQSDASNLILDDTNGVRDVFVRISLPSSDPAVKADCKKRGWVDHGFRNQGECIRFVRTSRDPR